jgi:hypothetical protein
MIRHKHRNTLLKLRTETRDAAGPWKYIFMALVAILEVVLEIREEVGK